MEYNYTIPENQQIYNYDDYFQNNYDNILLNEISTPNQIDLSKEK